MKNKYIVTITGNDTFENSRVVEAFNFSEAILAVEEALAPLTIEKFIKIEAYLLP